MMTSLLISVVLCFVAAAAMLSLPVETAGRKLAQSIDDDVVDDGEHEIGSALHTVSMRKQASDDDSSLRAAQSDASD